MKLSFEEISQISAYVMPDIPEGRADIGLIFGTRHGVEEFCIESYSLWKRAMFNKLLISGGCTRGEPESEATIIGTRLLQLGMPIDALILEHEATNTGENVILARKKKFRDGGSAKYQKYSRYWQNLLNEVLPDDD